jgi:hypothetical protein
LAARDINDSLPKKQPKGDSFGEEIAKRPGSLSKQNLGFFQPKISDVAMIIQFSFCRGVRLAHEALPKKIQFSFGLGVVAPLMRRYHET